MSRFGQTIRRLLRKLEGVRRRLPARVEKRPFERKGDRLVVTLRLGKGGESTFVVSEEEFASFFGVLPSVVLAASVEELEPLELSVDESIVSNLRLLRTWLEGGEEVLGVVTRALEEAALQKGLENALSSGNWTTGAQIVRALSERPASFLEDTMESVFERLHSRREGTASAEGIGFLLIELAGFLLRYRPSDEAAGVLHEAAQSPRVGLRRSAISALSRLATIEGGHEQGTRPLDSVLESAAPDDEILVAAAPGLAALQPDRLFVRARRELLQAANAGTARVQILLLKELWEAERMREQVSALLEQWLSGAVDLAWLQGGVGVAVVDMVPRQAGVRTIRRMLAAEEPAIRAGALRMLPRVAVPERRALAARAADEEPDPLLKREFHALIELSSPAIVQDRAEAL